MSLLSQTMESLRVWIITIFIFIAPHALFHSEGREGREREGEKERKEKEREKEKKNERKKELKA